MAIIKDVTVKINNGTATLDTPVQFYEKDHDVELRFRLMDYKYKYDKDPQNILNSVDEDILEAYTTIVNPRGYELEQINGVVKNDIVIFRLDPTYTDELDELGTYKLQIHIKCTHSEFTIPPITFEVLQRLKGIKVVTDGEDEVDNSEILDNSSKFVSDETGKLIIEWKKGDMISSAKLNAMVDVINDAVDEEKIRQANEKEREKKANNKIQELENTRVEYVNKFDDELDSFADQVDTTMSDYETRFNALTVSQQQDAEIIDARDGEQTLRARLDRDIQKPSIIYEEIEGLYITVDTTCGYLKDVEILGNTIQNQNDLADIRSVGDKLENQELYEIPVLSTGRNLVDAYTNLGEARFSTSNGEPRENPGWRYTIDYFRVEPNREIAIGETSTNYRQYQVSFYDVNYKWIETRDITTLIISTITPQNAYYMRFSYSVSVSGSPVDRVGLQVEYGSITTPYKEYREDKLTILSPTPLEKVGNVADRVVYNKELQTWGVEKNIGILILDGSEDWTMSYGGLTAETRPNTMQFYSKVLDNLAKGTDSICNKLPNVMVYSVDIEGLCLVGLDVNKLRIGHVSKSLDEFKKWLKQADVYVKFQLAQPQFIPLPYDQQIKLRTFANKTNISFQCEIEPTLKASVPKSIGASVSSHSEQIDNLGKELDKVKKLEESATSTVTTESDFTTVTETSNGYFEDVKLEGKTLVNLCKNGTGKTINSSDTDYDLSFIDLSIGKTYTLIINQSLFSGEGVRIGFLSVDKKNWIKTDFHIDYTRDNEVIQTFTFTDSTISELRIQAKGATTTSDVTSNHIINYVILLEGDHTQNPPSFFEGLKSVGQDVDEISVLSCNENLFDGELIVGSKFESNGEITSNSSCAISKNYININPKLSYKFSSNQNLTGYLVCEYDYNKKFIRRYEIVGTYIPSLNTRYVRLYCFVLNEDFDSLNTKLMFNVGDIVKPYQPHKQDKKRILYYNDETQAWEKPVLREWDSIEKHSDGKYYYHKRSGEVVLNGSEEWVLDSTQENTCRYRASNKNIKNSAKLIADRFMFRGNLAHGDYEYIFMNDAKNLYININKSKPSSQDVAGFKAWLQANPTTVVYELAEEKVYECTDLDLITYQNETNLMVEGGAIVPKTMLKVHQNIANIATILQEKVNVLENNVGHVTEVFVDSKIEPINNEICNINSDLTSLTESIEGSSVSVVSKDGYLKDIEILGNTIQNQNDLADIRSVGDKLENQELYEIPVLSAGKNLYNESKMVLGMIGQSTGEIRYEEKTYLSYEYYIPVKPNTTYVINKPNIINMMFYYDKDKKYISSESINISQTSFITPSNCKFIRFRIASTVLPKEFQLEEGTVATPYEPYQEDKLTILSPVQLEKVGDIADRIICKDGVWGVEKKIDTVIFNETYNWTTANTIAIPWAQVSMDIKTVYKTDLTTREKCLTNLPVTDVYSSNSNVGISYIYNIKNFRIRLKDTGTTADEIKEYLRSNPIVFKYGLDEYQFIPLPHDQQIKLRTFANKTNIHFGCEIEPTLKASIPKSLGATINTHTEQIDNLGKELDRVKKLEESTASTVTTESDFITVTETSNGYFEDVKIEGRTLVNLHSFDGEFKLQTDDSLKQIMYYFNGLSEKLINGNRYTFIIDFKDIAKTNTGGGSYFLTCKGYGQYETSYPITTKLICCVTAGDNATTANGMGLRIPQTDIDKGAKATITRIMVLEGDHTQNPPEYFEGLKSVGQDVDEISVLSCNENLFDVKSVIEKYPDKITPFGNGLSVISGVYALTHLIPDVNKQYTISWHGEIVEQSTNDAFIGFAFSYTDGTTDLMINTGDKVLCSNKEKTIKEFKISYSTTCTMNLTNISLVQGDTPKPYQPHKQDKKRILYYNDETQAWEKPILREWDSIEKHSDGKYYYHKRSGEVVLNGSEGWACEPPMVNTIYGICTVDNVKYLSEIRCDKFKGYNYSIYADDIEGIYTAKNRFKLKISNSKLSTQDVQGFKQWLQSNNVTVVYQLAEEKVYECTSIDLITYENETNFIVNTGAITPKSTLKVMCNITNVVRELQQKVSNLENYIQHVMIDALNNALNE